MVEHVMAATDATGKRIAECTLAAEPTLNEAADYGTRHRTNYVSVRHANDDITLYGKDAAGTWSVLLANAPATVVVEIRRRHDEVARPEADGYDWDADGQGDFGYRPNLGSDYVLSAVTLDGDSLAERVMVTAPTPAEAAQFGDHHEANYVLVGREDAEVFTIYGRSADNTWSVLAADVDDETGEDVCLWFDLIQQHQGLAGGGVETLFEQISTPERGLLSAERATSLVVDHIRSRRLDYPLQGLTAERFPAGWSVYAAVEIDESDPMVFLDLPVGRSVFLVSDLGRVKEVSSSVPPQDAEELFTAEEAYVRRGSPETSFRDGLMESGSQGLAGINSFTLDVTTEELIATRAARLLAPITQQLALLGPSGWDRFAAVFSCTVSGEVAQLRFWTGDRRTEVRVPEQIAVLVRRQRHLAAQLPAGPWWRLLLGVGQGDGTSAQISVDYDYGDEPLPKDDLLAPECYRDDLAAYPRASTPPWLAAYAQRATSGPTPVPEPEPKPKPVPVLDTQHDWKRLYADPKVITFGKRSLALDQVEWVSYCVTRTATKRFLFPTTHASTWEFSVGTYPYLTGPMVSTRFYQPGRGADQPEAWTFLVNLAREYLEPRLLADLVGRVRRGETVTVGASVKVNQGGIACAKPKVSLPWNSIAAVQPSNGMICIYQAGVEKPVLTVPLNYPNAGLIPDLVAELTA